MVAFNYPLWIDGQRLRSISSDMVAKRAPWGFFPEALLLVAVTFGGYSYAYLLEIGRSIYFGYPPQMIGPTLFSLQSVSLFGTMIALFLFLQLILQYWPEMWRRDSFIIVILFFVVNNVYQAIFGIGSFITFMVLFASISSLIVNLFYRNQSRSTVNGNASKSSESVSVTETSEYEVFPFATFFDRNSTIWRGSLAASVLRRLGYDPFTYTFIFVVLFPLYFGITGFLEAAARRELYVIRSAVGDELVIRIVGNRLISVPFDESAGAYQRKLRLRQLDQLGDLLLEPVGVSRLVVAKP